MQTLRSLKYWNPPLTFTVTTKMLSQGKRACGHTHTDTLIHKRVKIEPGGMCVLINCLQLHGVVRLALTAVQERELCDFTIFANYQAYLETSLNQILDPTVQVEPEPHVPSAGTQRHLSVQRQPLNVTFHECSGELVMCDVHVEAGKHN